jgi:hypothetical protein
MNALIDLLCPTSLPTLTGFVLYTIPLTADHLTYVLLDRPTDSGAFSALITSVFQ